MSISVTDLRHTFVRLTLLGGAKPKFALEASGHSGIAFTMDFCSPIIEGVRQDAMMLLDGVLPKTEDGLFAESKAKLTPPSDID